LRAGAVPKGCVLQLLFRRHARWIEYSSFLFDDEADPYGAGVGDRGTSLLCAQQAYSAELGCVNGRTSSMRAAPPTSGAVRLCALAAWQVMAGNPGQS
jgi:hypothetical protein